MRKLDVAPRALAEGDGPLFGSFQGGLPRLDFGNVPKSALWKLLHKKRWIYVAVCDERVFAGIAVVSLGYASTCIVFVLDRKTGAMLADRSLLVPNGAVTFSDGGSGQRSARFSFGASRVEVGDGHIEVDLPRAGSSPPVHIFANMPPRDIPPPISAIVPIHDGYANATEKRILEGTGEIVAGGLRFLLDKPLVGVDHTFGYLARHTVWRWAFALGRTSNGERLAFNLTQGFVGEPECGVWLGDELFPVGEGRFYFDEANPSAPWKLETTCGSLDLTFTPAGIHAEEKNLLVVSSKFIQPVGSFAGSLRLGDREIRVERLGGVTEHQDALW